MQSLIGVYEMKTSLSMRPERGGSLEVTGAAPLLGRLVSNFIRFLAPKCKSVIKQAAFYSPFPHRVFVGRGEYTGATIPRKAALSLNAFPKNQRPSPPCPLSRLPTPSPAAPDSCDSGALPSLPSPAQAPALARRFATPVRRPVPVARDSRADPLSAAPAGHPQRPCRRTRDQ
jgi:hypothetical protein